MWCKELAKSELSSFEIKTAQVPLYFISNLVLIAWARSVIGDNMALVFMMVFSMNVFVSSEIGGTPTIVRNLKADILIDFLK